VLPVQEICGIAPALEHLPSDAAMPASRQDSAEGVGPLSLSVLDQSPIAEGSTGAQALERTLDLAALADRLGYHRFWVAEHHATPMLAGAAPEALIGPIAATTDRIRVGSGGVMLHHYSPRKVAETFSVLGGLFPGRIDLGLGRGADADAVTTHALQRDRRVPDPQDYPDQLAELVAYLDDRPPPDRRFAGLAALPGLPGRPEPWLLGSSLESALWAGQLGLPYAFGDFINPAGAQIAHLYRQSFAGCERLPAPQVAVSVAAICADTDEQAHRLAASVRMCAQMSRLGTPIPVPPVERALRHLEEGDGPATPPTRRMVLGSPTTVRAGLETIAEEYRASEVIVVTVTHSHAARERSYELIAQAFGLRCGADRVAQTA
jgi:luciferase family oxidoreductase group 1